MSNWVFCFVSSLLAPHVNPYPGIIQHSWILIPSMGIEYSTNASKIASLRNEIMMLCGKMWIDNIAKNMAIGWEMFNKRISLHYKASIFHISVVYVSRDTNKGVQWRWQFLLCFVRRQIVFTVRWCRHQKRFKQFSSPVPLLNATVSKYLDGGG